MSSSLLFGAILASLITLQQFFRVRSGKNPLVIRNPDGTVFGGFTNVLFGLWAGWFAIGVLVGSAIGGLFGAGILGVVAGVLAVAIMVVLGPILGLLSAVPGVLFGNAWAILFFAAFALGRGWRDLAIITALSIGTRLPFWILDTIRSLRGMRDQSAPTGSGDAEVGG